MRWRLLLALGAVLAMQSVAGTTYAWDNWPSEWSPSRPSIAAQTVDVPPVRSAAYVDAAVFRLDVPFRTQKDGGRWQTSNCGPAVLGMVLDAFRIPGQTTDDLRFRSHTYQGTVGMRTGTALQHIAHVAEDLGVRTTGLYNEGGQFNAWSIDDIRGQLRLGHPVMPLVRLYLLPGNEGAGTRWGHYILLTGLTEDGFFYNDPLQTSDAAGLGRYIPAWQLAQAIANSHIPGQAVAFGVDLPLLSYWTPSA